MTARTIGRAWQMAWANARGLLFGLIAASIVPSLFGPGSAWLSKQILDNVVLAARGEVPALIPLYYVAAELVLAVANAWSNGSFAYFSGLLGERMSLALKLEILEHAVKMSTSAFERTETYNDLQRANKEADERAQRVLLGSLSVAQSSFTLLLLSTMLSRTSPWMVFAISIAAIPGFIANAYFSNRSLDLSRRQTPGQRELTYIQTLLTRDQASKEIKIFRLGRFFLSRFRDVFEGLLDESRRHERRRVWMASACQLLSSSALYSCYGLVAWRAAHGDLTVGDLALCLIALRDWEGTLANLLSSIRAVREDSLFLGQTLSLIGDERAHETSTSDESPAATGVGALEFDDVWFAYGDADRPDPSWVLKGLSLNVRPGERIAIVGANGAGKTTLAKLLLGLYEPMRGSVRVNGIDVRLWPKELLRKQFGVLFQDFVRFQASLRENIAYGRRGDDLDASDHAIDDAIDLAGLDDVVRKLPRGRDTRLGFWFDDGTDLSGGEWQRVALGRAFMRQAPFLVLDEPTTAMDPRSEHDFVQRLDKLTRGQTTFVISHRMRMAQKADRIEVIEDGRIVELGPHDQLLSEGGRYAEFWRLQHLEE